MNLFDSIGLLPMMMGGMMPYFGLSDILIPLGVMFAVFLLRIWIVKVFMTDLSGIKVSYGKFLLKMIGLILLTIVLVAGSIYLGHILFASASSGSMMLMMVIGLTAICLLVPFFLYTGVLKHYVITKRKVVWVMLFEMGLSIVISFLSGIISLLVSMSSLMNSPMLSMLGLGGSDNFYGSSSNDFMFDMDGEEGMSTANIGVANMYDDENNDDEVYPIEDIGVSNNINSESSSESSSESEEEFDNSELDIFAQLAAEANQEDEVEILEEDEEEISLEIEEEVEEEVETIENNNEEEIDEEQEENNTSIEDTTQSIIDEELETVGGFDEAVAIIDTVGLTNDDMQKLYDETKTLPLIESENSFDAGKLALDDYINKVRSNTAQHDINLNACTKQTYGYKDIEGNKEILILTGNQGKLMQATTMSMDANGNEEEKDIYLMTQTTSAQTMSAILTEQNNALDDYQYILLSESELEDQCGKITYTDENIDQTLVGTLFEGKIMKWELK